MHEDDPLAVAAANHRGRLLRAARRLLGPAEAEDAVQDAYVRALEAREQPLDEAQAWLLTVMRNLAIDRLRRRRWMDQWLAVTDHAGTAPSAEAHATLADEAAAALRLLAGVLSPRDGAVVLLHDIFEASHAEIAEASGRAEAHCRQQLRRARLRLRQASDTAKWRRRDPDAGEEAVFRVYLQALQWRDARPLWAMLREPPVTAQARVPDSGSCATSAVHATSRIVQAGGRLGLAVELAGVTLCVLPLGEQLAYETAAP